MGSRNFQLYEANRSTMLIRKKWNKFFNCVCFYHIVFVSNYKRTLNFGYYGENFLFKLWLLSLKKGIIVKTLVSRYLWLENLRKQQEVGFSF